jgi:hypothetical protein
MTRAQLNHAVARITGESLRTVRHRGFGVLTKTPRDLEPEDIVLCVDCSFCGGPVPYRDQTREGTPALAECDHCDLEFEFALDEVYTATPDAVSRANDLAGSNSATRSVELESHP